MTQYTDSRGAEMEPISWSEALGTISELASQNQLTDHHVTGDDALRGMMDWQQAAIDTVDALVSDHAETLNDLKASTAAGDWPAETLAAKRDMDPTQPLSAILICLDLAEGGAMDPDDADGIEMADEIDRQQQSLDVVRDLAGMHGQEVSKIVIAAAPAAR